MAWSPDGKTFYLAHSMQHEVFAHSFDEGTGLLGARRSFVRTPEALGVPDGACVDTEGAYWCALHGGGRLQRYTAAGKLNAEILLPVSQPTMCAFGGVALDTLYITSARDKLTAAQLRDEPLAGALLCVRPGLVGTSRRCTVR
jgi:sugar lactone lactonase YvrE